MSPPVIDSSQFDKEFEPVQLSDNTELKVPVQCKEPSEDEALSEFNQSGSVVVDPFFAEYNRLVQWYQDLPSGMFLSKLICEYRSSESDLEATRQMFFEAIKSYDDFPYDLNTELKRRLYTRRGEPPVNKIANDIYILLSICDGAEYSDMKEMLSNGKTRSNSTGPVRPKASGNSTSVNTPRKSQTENTASQGTSVISVAEFKMMKDTLSQVQAEVLNMKQTALAAEKVRSDQIKVIRSTVESIKHDLYECNRTISNHAQSNVKTIESMKPLENMIRSTENRVQKLEDFLDESKILTVEKLATAFYGGKNRCGTDNINSLTNRHQQSSEAPTCLQGPALFTPPPPPPAPLHPPPLVPSIIPPPPLVMWRQPFSGPYVGNSTHHDDRLSLPTMSRNAVPVANSTDIGNIPTTGADVSSGSRSDVTAGSSSPRPLPIPVRVTSHEESTMNDGFFKTVRRKPRKLFVGGYSTSVSTEDINKIVNRNGAVVKNISIFPSRMAHNKVVIRLCVADDETAEGLLQNNVWPQGVSCKQWLSRDKIQRGGHNNRSAGEHIPPRFRRVGHQNRLCRLSNPTDISENKN